MTADIKQAICSKGFIIGLLGLIAAMIIASLEDIIELFRKTEPLESGFHGQLIQDALQSDTIIFILPILCTLPYTTAFLDDIKSGFIKPYLIRSSHSQYIKGKLFACGFSGALVLFIGIQIAYWCAYLILSPMELAPDARQATEAYWPELILQSFMPALSGMFWSLVGFTLCAVTMNRYMAYASPFILYYVFIILHERYFEELYIIYPKEWLFPSKAWILGDFGIALLIAELTLAVGLCFTFVAKRRLSNV